MTVDEKVRSCPYHQRDQFEKEVHEGNGSSIKEKAIQIGHSVFQVMGDYCPYARYTTNWALNSFSYYYDGNIPSLFKIMQIGDTKTYEPYKEVPIAHKLNCMVITDPDMIAEILGKFRDGQEWSGGPEFDAVRYVTGDTNPLTETDWSKQGILKSFTMTHHFSPESIKAKTLEFMTIADEFVDDSLQITDDYDTFNMTTTIPEYTLDISARIILGVNSDYSELTQAIGTLEGLATDMILYNPSSFIPNILDSSRATSQDQLKRAVKKIVKESKDGKGIAAIMKQQKRYTDTQERQFKKVRDEITSSEIDSEQKVMRKMYDFMNSKHYQSHFFQIAEEQGYDIPYLRQLKDVEKGDLADLREDFFSDLQENRELTAFLDILSHMIASKDTQKFDKRQIADIVKTVLVIGSGTTKSAILSCLYCLVKHPEEQEKLYQALRALDITTPTADELEKFQALTLETVEQYQYASILDVVDNTINKDPDFAKYQEVRGKPFEELTKEEFELLKRMKLKCINNTIYEKIIKCPALENFVKEVMRQYPPIAIQARKAKQDNEVKGVTIPQGWTVFLANIISNNDESRWPDPETFDPSRFEDKKNKIHSFNHGINQCMGRFQVTSTVNAFLYTTVMKYKVLPPINMDDEVIDQNFILSAGVALKFDKPLYARFQERE